MLPADSCLPDRRWGRGAKDIFHHTNLSHVTPERGWKWKNIIETPAFRGKVKSTLVEQESPVIGFESQPVSWRVLFLARTGNQHGSIKVQLFVPISACICQWPLPQLGSENYVHRDHPGWIIDLYKIYVKPPANTYIHMYIHIYIYIHTYTTR